MPIPKQVLSELIDRLPPFAIFSPYTEALDEVTHTLRDFVRYHRIVSPAEVGYRVQGRVKEFPDIIDKVDRKEKESGEELNIDSLKTLEWEIDDIVGARGSWLII